MEHANIQQLPITFVLEQNIYFYTVVIFLAEKSNICMSAGIVFSFSLFVVFPGKEGYLKVLTWDFFLLCVTRQNIVIWDHKKTHMGSDLCFERA